MDNPRDYNLRAAAAVADTQAAFGGPSKRATGQTAGDQAPPCATFICAARANPRRRGGRKRQTTP